MFIAFIIIVILLGGVVLLLRQAGRAAHPLLQSLRSRGIRLVQQSCCCAAGHHLSVPAG